MLPNIVIVEKEAPPQRAMIIRCIAPILPEIKPVATARMDAGIDLEGVLERARTVRCFSYGLQRG
jgi:hypothetical protein